MSFIGCHAKHYKENGFVDRKKELDYLFSDEHQEVIKSKVHGTVYYAAVKKKTTGIVFGLVVDAKIHTKDYFNLLYKDMTEFVGPQYYSCPKPIIDLLSPTDNPYALEWREKCLEYNNKQKRYNRFKNRLNPFPVGTKIKLPDGIVLEKNNSGAWYGDNNNWTNKDIFDYCNGVYSVLQTN